MQSSGTVQGKPTAIATYIISAPTVNPSPTEITLAKYLPNTTAIGEFITNDESSTDSNPISAAILFNVISNYVDTLFFECYIPAETMKPRWYLVQVHFSRNSKRKRHMNLFLFFLSKLSNCQS